MFDCTPGDDMLRGLIRRARRAQRSVQAADQALFDLLDYALNSGVRAKALYDPAVIAKAQRDGVTGVVIEPADRGNTVAVIAGFERPVWLGRSAVLPALLEALCEPGANDHGGPLVGYKTPAELVRRVEDLSGRRINAHALRQHVETLRGRLVEAGLNRTFIPNKHGVGYRFVLKRSGHVKVVRPPRS